MHHLISGINSATHFVSHILIYLLLTYHISMIISPRQRHHHHSCHSSPPSFFHSNLKTFLFLKSYPWHPLGLTPRLFGPAHGFYVYPFQFFLSFSFCYYSLFFIFLVFLNFSCLYFSHFLNFVIFTFNTISIFGISHFIFLLNISVFLVYVLD